VTRNWQRLPPGPMDWTVDDTGIYLVLRGRRHRVKNAAVFANGTRDAVIIEERGRIKLASMNQPISCRRRTRCRSSSWTWTTGWSRLSGRSAAGGPWPIMRSTTPTWAASTGGEGGES